MNIMVGKRVLGRLFSTGIGNFNKVEQTSSTISEVGDPVNQATELSMFKSQLRSTWFQKREELKFAVRSAVVKFGVAFYKDEYSDWVEGHMHCAAFGGSYFVKECKI